MARRAGPRRRHRPVRHTRPARPGRLGRTPVLLADEAGSVVAAAHVGRQGLVRGVLPATVSAMADLGAAPANLRAAVGPSVCGRCYEVPRELQEEVAAVVPGTATTTSWGTPRSTSAPGCVTS
ncbi:polyphenol oxidase family protein [Georgenia sp. SUBG003]|uniref:polyphenol oxidase family protein n=1 Tax=Georgenia sp. SUBG003 TaxID=1497974 RepID=UPI003AB7661B